MNTGTKNTFLKAKRPIKELFGLSHHIVYLLLITLMLLVVMLLLIIGHSSFDLFVYIQRCID